MIENVLGFPILSTLVIIPVLGAIILLFLKSGKGGMIRVFALGITIINFVVSLLLPLNFDTGTYKMQFTERASWIPSIGAEYLVGIDGISLLLILLTTLITAIAVLSSWTAIEEKIKGYMICLLILEAGMIGVFISLDLVVFYLFWEISLVPMYFLIGVWGGPKKLYATMKFFLYTLFGSIFMLLGILAVYSAHGAVTGEYTFSLLKLYEVTYPYNLQWWAFLAFFMGFAIKVPMFPFHTWLPDAHVQAPTAGSVILAAILLKMGTYGFLRFNLPLFPSASKAFIPFIIVLAVIGIVYGALLAMAQKDMKKLIAYSSVSHLGFAMAGIFAMNHQGLSGGILQMINHGVSTGGLFLLVGMIYERRHTRMMADLGGLAKQLPVYAVFTLLIILASIGFPGTNGFISEFLILLGLFKIHWVVGALAALGITLGVVYMLWMYKRIMLGKLDKPENKELKDLSLREIVTLLPIIFFIFLIGLYPKPFLNAIEAPTTHLLEIIKRNDVKAHIAESNDHSTQQLNEELVKSVRGENHE